jgi:Zn-dependent protease with chaperone function
LTTIALVVGFYSLALVIAGILVYIPYAEWVYLDRVHAKVALGCIGGAGIILWSILPRPDRFEPPGPRLDPAREPRLFEKLRSIATATGQDMPAEVYLVPEVNAWVAERGGVAGFGSRRVMGLGLPLMQALTVPQLQAVLAHEFGHYFGGDTKLGPWIYKTRAAMARTLQNLAEHESALQLPFEWYGGMFLRITHSVSRQQEYAADALAARTVGARPLAEALSVIHGAGNAFQPYIMTEVLPLLGSGYRPPIAAGFEKFMAAPPIASAISKVLAEELAQPKTDPLDTHPPLRDRLRALKSQGNGGASAAAPRAVELLSNLDVLEKQLLQTLNPQGDIEGMKRVAWEKTIPEVWLPNWQSAVDKAGTALAGLTPADLPKLAGDLIQFGRKLVDKNQLLPFKELAAHGSSALGCALALALHRAGWTIHSEVGEPLWLGRESHRIELFSIVPRLENGELSAQDWQAQCAELGIAHLPLAPKQTPSHA